MNKIIAVLAIAFGCFAPVAYAEGFEVGVNYDLLPVPVEPALPTVPPSV